MKNKLYYCLLFLVSLSVTAQKADLIPFKKGGKYGYSDRDKKIILPVQYNAAYPFGYKTPLGVYQDYALVQVNDETYIINKKGEIIDTAAKFDKKAREEYLKSEDPPGIIPLKTVDYTQFEENGKKGVKDEDGSIILKPDFEYIDIRKFTNHYRDPKAHKSYNPTYASVYKNNKSYLIRLDKMNVYDDLSLSSYTADDDFFIVSTNKKPEQCGIFYEDSVKLFDPKYIKILAYYPHFQLICIENVVNDHPYDFYMDMDGNEYYE